MSNADPFASLSGTNGNNDAQVDFSFLDFKTSQTTTDWASEIPTDPVFDQNRETESIGQAFKDLYVVDPSTEDGTAPPNPEEDQIDLPPWACSYCGISNPASVVKCLNTNKWFCNGRTIGSASCIMTHLVKGRYKEVSLHKMSPLGETVLECYASGSRNVFALGYVPLLDENTVVLLARDTPASAVAIKDLNLDITQWQPLIQDRVFVDWLVRHPSPEELRRAHKLTLDETYRLEELWKAGTTNATLKDLVMLPEKEDDFLPIALHYEDAKTYENIFSPLITLEAEYDKSMKESQKREGVTVHWGLSLNKRHLARFYYPKDSTDMRIMVGDELRLRHACPSFGSPAWQGTGVVIRLDVASEEVVVEMYYGSGMGPKSGWYRAHKNASSTGNSTGNNTGTEEEDSRGPPPTDVTSNFSIEYVWKGVSYERMHNALRSFSVDETSVSGYLYHSILGHETASNNSNSAATSVHALVPKKLTAPGLPDLNHSQIQAVQRVLSQPLSLIQGPPGTGKTVTSASLVYHLAKQGQGQVLVTAPSNIAVDHLADKISLTGLRVVRLQAKSREEIATNVEHLTLQYQIRNLKVPEAVEVKKLQLLREELGELSSSDDRKYRYLLKSLEKEILHAADVVCCTCVGAGDPRLQNFRFRRVLIDEATQAVEPEALIPLVMGCKQAVLVGDHCQLGPVILNKRASTAGLGQSMFERLILLGIRPIRLAVQYRMHPALSAFPSNTFYEGALQNGVSAAERAMPAGAFPWPSPTRPLVFWSQLGAEEISSSGTSYLNRTEAMAVEKAVTSMLRGGVIPDQIGIITPYEGQRAHVLAVMMRNGPLKQSLYSQIEVSSVDSFQGREKDYIILSCVRSNEHQGIGFLSDPRRLNVALTRARFGLIVLGNPRVLSKQAVWGALLCHFRGEDALVEGSLNALKQCSVQLGRHARTFNAGLFGLGGALSSRFRPVEKAGDRRGGADEGAPGSSSSSHQGHEDIYDRNLRDRSYMHPYSISSHQRHSHQYNKESKNRAAQLTQSSMSTHLEYGTQGSAHGGVRGSGNLSQGSLMGSVVNGFQSQQGYYYDQEEEHA